MKKLMKKMLAVLMASSCMFSAVAMNSNALYSIKDINSPDLAWLNDGEHILLDKKYNDYFVDDYIYSDEQIKNALLYSNKEGTELYALIPMKEKLGCGGAFNLTDGTTEEEVEAFLSEKISPNYQITMNWQNSNYAYSISKSLKECREVCNLLKEENFIDSFVIIDNVVQFKRYGFSVGDILGYECNEEELELMKNYVKETDFADIQVVGTDNRISGIYTEIILKPKTETTVEERLDMAVQIMENAGFAFNCVSPASNTTAGTSYIDVFNAVDGDANEDGQTDLADATAIIQAIGNPDKYALSAQGEFNADVNGNGLTGADAIAIQRQLIEAGMPE